MPSAPAVLATRRPMLPTPMMPRVLPFISKRPCQRPLPQSALRVRWSTTTACLAHASISMIACSATEFELEPGACTTATPRSVAAGRSTMSRPTPWRPTTLSFRQAAIRLRVQSGLERNRIPSASLATATIPPPPRAAGAHPRLARGVGHDHGGLRLQLRHPVRVNRPAEYDEWFHGPHY